MLHILYKSIGIVAFMVSLSLGLISCTPEPESKVLKVGSNQWMGYEPLFLAREKGQYDPSMVKLVELQSSTDTLRLLRAGMIDAGMLTLDEVLSEVALGTELEVVMVVDASAGADVLLVKPSLKSLADIKGKRVGVENGAVGATLLNGALLEAGLDVSDIVVVPLKLNQHLSAYMQGEVDVLVTFEPISSQLLKQGAVKLFDSRKIPNQIIDVLAVRKSVVSDAESSIKRLIDGYFFALDFLKKHPAEAVQLMAPRLGISSAEMLAGYEGISLAGKDGNKRLFSGQPKEIVEVTNKLQVILLRANLLTQKIDAEKLFNAQFVVP